MHDLFLNINCKIQTLMTCNADRKDSCLKSEFIIIQLLNQMESNYTVLNMEKTWGPWSSKFCLLSYLLY